jgi:hypothetical protein
MMIANSVGGGGYIIQGSGLFGGTTSDFLDGYVPSTPTDNNVWTYEAVVKLSAIGTIMSLLDSTSSDTVQAYIRINSNGLIRVFDYNSGTNHDINSYAELRDPSAYYSIVVAFDSGEASATDRVKIWINGTAQSTQGDAPSLNAASYINTSGREMNIGNNTGGSVDSMFDGYFARATFIDGQALNPTSFGELTDDGFWQINDVSELTFGNNGFLIEGGAAMSAGTDSSGNSKSFTKTGTITATNDSPTNGGDDDEYGNYATLNPLDLRMSAVAATLSNGNLNIATGGGGGRGSTIMLPSSGKYKVELIPTGTINTSSFGITSSTTNDGNMLRTGAVIKIDGSNSQTGLTAMAVGQVHVMLIDMDAMTVQFKLNNANTGSAAALSADAGLGYMIHTWDSDGNTDWSVNFGQLGFTHEDADYLPLATQNLPTPAVVNYEDEYYIEAGISHSNGSTTAVTLPKSVSGGAMVRIKRTDSTGSWYVFDTVRGANKFVYWDSRIVEDSSTFDDQNLTGTTFTIPSDMATGTYLLECFYMGSYFQIQTYTGNATNRTVSFAATLDSAPGFGCVINRSVNTGSQVAQHSALLGTQFLNIDTAATAQTYATVWNSTLATTTEFSLGTDTTGNKNTDSYVGYFWANSGPYAFGSYNPNNSADGPMINLGGMPATMVVKRNGGSSWNWTLITKVIDTYNEGYQYLEPNTTIAPNTSSTVNEFDLVSNGLKVREAGNNSLNGTPASDIQVYGAFGIQPLTDGAVNQGRAK